MARRIIDRFPDHQTYVEPFAGGASVLLNKPPSSVEVLADLDADLIGFYHALRDGPDLVDRLATLEYAEATFRQALEAGPVSGVEGAVRFLVRNRMSRGGLGQDFAWSDRLREVEILEAPALDVIRRFDGPETLVYCDPPYLHSTRTARDAYAHEMTEADHVTLLDALGRCRGSVVLSGYPSTLYDRALADWERVEYAMPNHAGQGRSKQRRIEVLWIKPVG